MGHKTLPEEIILASRNPHKLEELQSVMREAGIPIQWISALDIDGLPEVEEDQDTLEGNALKKAREVATQTGLPTLADDTGLEVDALDGRPGVYSARYAGEEATYQDNVDKLLEDLQDVSVHESTARFRTVIALVLNGEEHTFHGTCEGHIIKQAAGEGGFGYDPVFRPLGYEETFAQLDPAVKNRISHRGHALQKLIAFLKLHT
ncbi:MAG: RdgB/HAM1 family non-canonical purine NTP pyrophosphatase [Bacteroidota bacterium]